MPRPFSAVIGAPVFSACDGEIIGALGQHRPRECRHDARRRAGFGHLAIDTATKLFAHPSSDPERASCNSAHATNACVAAALQRTAQRLGSRALTTAATNSVAGLLA